MVAMVAWGRATCASSAIVTLSRNLRWTRVLTVRRNHVPAAETPRAMDVRRSRVELPAASASAISLNQRASSASGTAAIKDSPNAHVMSVGSYRNPSRQSRHIDGSDAGRSSFLGEDVMRHALLVGRLAEALRLQVEHRAIPATQRHELIVAPKLDDPAVLQHADAVGEPNGRESMRDQNRGTVRRLGQD